MTIHIRDLTATTTAGATTTHTTTKTATTAPLNTATTQTDSINPLTITTTLVFTPLVLQPELMDLSSKLVLAVIR